MPDYVKAEGLIHMVNPIQGEFTLCGDAFDLASDVPGYEWKARRRGPVTCQSCAAIVIECRGVRTRAEP
jgi:hypothetical protein